MYLVELVSGNEAIYRSLDEFADAIRRGEVTTQSRIYHRAASTWVSVTFHPQFRKVAAEQADGTAGATEQADRFAQPLPLRDWTYLRADLGTASSVREVVAPEVAAPEVAPHEDVAGEPVSPPRTDAQGTAPAVQGRSWRKVLGKLVGQH